MRLDDTDKKNPKAFMERVRKRFREDPTFPAKKKGKRDVETFALAVKGTHEIVTEFHAEGEDGEKKEYEVLGVCVCVCVCVQPPLGTRL